MLLRGGLPSPSLPSLPPGAWVDPLGASALGPRTSAQTKLNQRLASPGPFLPIRPCRLWERKGSGAAATAILGLGSKCEVRRGHQWGAEDAGLGRRGTARGREQRGGLGHVVGCAHRRGDVETSELRGQRPGRDSGSGPSDSAAGEKGLTGPRRTEEVREAAASRRGH